MKYHFSMTKKCLCCLFGLAVSGQNESLFRRVAGHFVRHPVAVGLRTNPRHPRRHVRRRFAGRHVHPPLSKTVPLFQETTGESVICAKDCYRFLSNKNAI